MGSKFTTKQNLEPEVASSGGTSSTTTIAKGCPFSNEEIATLLSTFDELKRNRDALALDILNSVSSDDDIAARYRKSHYRLGDSWTVLGLGVILLSGIERCLLRVAQPDKLKQTSAKLVKHHRKMGITARQMRTAFRLAQPVFMLHLRSNHTCPALIKVDGTTAAAAARKIIVSTSFLPSKTNKMDDQNESKQQEQIECQKCACWVKFFDHVIKQFKD